MYIFFPEDHIPSEKKTIKITETQYYKLKWPAQVRTTPKRYIPIEGEVWRQIGMGWPDTYYVSDLGRIKNVRILRNGREVASEIRGHCEREKKWILITKGKVRIKDFFANIVLRTFDPRANFKSLQAINLDGDYHNCKLLNLSWMTTKEATEHRIKIGIYKPKLAVKNIYRNGKWVEVKVRYTDFQISEMNRLIDAGISINKISKIFDCRGPQIKSYVLSWKKRKEYLNKTNELSN